MINLRQYAKGQECMVRIPNICNFNPETTILAHLGGAGMGIKHNDILGAWCCNNCHDVIDGRRRSKYLTRLEVRVYHLEGILRTQQELIKEGML